MQYSNKSAILYITSTVMYSRSDHHRSLGVADKGPDYSTNRGNKYPFINVEHTDIDLGTARFRKWDPIVRIFGFRISFLVPTYIF